MLRPTLDPEYDGIWDYMWCTDTLEGYFGRNAIDDMWPFSMIGAITVHCKQKYNVTRIMITSRINSEGSLVFGTALISCSAMAGLIPGAAGN